MDASRISQRGVALIAVLWLVAAMGVIIVGVVKSVRGEIRTIGLQRQSLMANARADAAILLALQALHAQQKEPGAAVQTISVAFEGQTNLVSVTPLNGRIDINSASPSLLVDLYRYAGGLSSEAAQSLAQGTVERRQTKNVKGLSQGFDANEDLLQVPQMTYSVYVKLADLITADVQQGNGRVNPLAAPLGVLQVLAGGNAARATALLSSRNANPSTIDVSFFKAEHIDMASSRSLRLQVQLDLPQGATTVRAWDVYWGAEPRSGLPWRVLSTHQVLLGTTPSNN